MRVLLEFSITTTDGDKGTVSLQGNLRLPEAVKRKADFRAIDIRSIDGMSIKFN